jgi:hypothetical protein
MPRRDGLRHLLGREPLRRRRRRPRRRLRSVRTVRVPPNLTALHSRTRRAGVPLSVVAASDHDDLDDFAVRREDTRDRDDALVNASGHAVGFWGCLFGAFARGVAAARGHGDANGPRLLDPRGPSRTRGNSRSTRNVLNSRWGRKIPSETAI